MDNTPLVDKAIPTSKRFHFLDWWRIAVVAAVVFGHSTLMGLGGGINPDGKWGVPSDVLVDDRGWNMEDPAPISVRAVSISRYIAIPLVFWISGSVAANTFNGTLKGLGKLVSYCLIGISCNTIMWFLGPRDTNCGPLDGCKAGILLNFTIVPGTGNLFPLVFQMWYVMALIVFQVMHWPIMVVLHGSGALRTSLEKKPIRISLRTSLVLIMLQFMCTSSFYIFLIWLADSDFPSPFRLATILIGSEAIYLLVAAAASPEAVNRISHVIGKADFPWIRLQQYMLAFIGLLQYSAAPIAESIDSLNVPYLLFIFIAFSKFYFLGYVMMKCRKYEIPSRVFSYMWPFVVVALVWCPPSTNWQLAGNLTYPFLPRVSDRILNSVFGVMSIFCFDCIGQLVVCVRLPNVLHIWSLTLYLFHPPLLTVFIVCGQHSVQMLWLLTCTTSFIVVFLAHLVLGWKMNK